MPTLTTGKCQLKVSIWFGREGPELLASLVEGKGLKALSSSGFYCQESFSRGGNG